MWDPFDDLKSSADNVWRELAASQGEALETYSRTLKEFGRGEVTLPTVARGAVNFAATAAVDEAIFSWRLAAEYYRWAASLAGVRIDPAAREQRPANAGPERESG